MGFNVVNRTQETLAHIGTAFATQSWANRWEAKASPARRRSLLTAFRYRGKKMAGEKCRHCGEETVFRYDSGNTVCRTCGEIKPI